MIAVPLAITAAAIWWAWRSPVNEHPLGYRDTERMVRLGIAALIAVPAWVIYFAVA